jgi:hypothetical protein
VIITVLGWMALVKGVLILVQPKLMITLTKALMEKEKFLKIETIIIIIMGVALSFLGFCPKSPI